LKVGIQRLTQINQKNNKRMLKRGGTDLEPVQQTRQKKVKLCGKNIRDIDDDKKRAVAMLCCFHQRVGALSSLVVLPKHTVIDIVNIALWRLQCCIGQYGQCDERRCLNIDLLDCVDGKIGTRVAVLTNSYSDIQRLVSIRGDVILVEYLNTIIIKKKVEEGLWVDMFSYPKRKFVPCMYCVTKEYIVVAERLDVTVIYRKTMQHKKIAIEKEGTYCVYWFSKNIFLLVDNAACVPDQASISPTIHVVDTKHGCILPQNLATNTDHGVIKWVGGIIPNKALLLKTSDRCSIIMNSVDGGIKWSCGGILQEYSIQCTMTSSNGMCVNFDRENGELRGFALDDTPFCKKVYCKIPLPVTFIDRSPMTLCAFGKTISAFGETYGSDDLSVDRFVTPFAVLKKREDGRIDFMVIPSVCDIKRDVVHVVMIDEDTDTFGLVHSTIAGWRYEIWKFDIESPLVISSNTNMVHMMSHVHYAATLPISSNRYLYH
jgi:hypothetical protein